MNIKIIKKIHWFLLSIIYILFFTINIYANVNIDKAKEGSNNTLYDDIHNVLCVNEYYAETNIEEMDSVSFGKYYISEKYKKEPIEWLVLKKDEEHGRALLLSKYILDYKQFDTTHITSWSVSKLRKWLNDDFLKIAFDKEEQEIIKTTKIKTKYDPSNYVDTEDKIFCFTYDEVKEYFKYDYDFPYYDEEKMSTNPTKYAEENRYDSGYWGYWGREYRNGILVLTASGSIISKNADNKMGVRPAMWVEYGEAIEEQKTEEKKLIEKDKKNIINIDNKWTDIIDNTVSLEEINSAYDVLGTIKFGKYEQDGNIDNGKEDIEWYVINCDLQYNDDSIEEKNKYLLLSKYALEYMIPDRKKILNKYSYEKSNVRKWLNNNFYENAFNEEEKKLILECEKKKIYYRKTRNIFEEVKNKYKTKYIDKVLTLNYSYLPDVWFDYKNVKPTKYIMEKYGIKNFEEKDIFDYYSINCIDKKMGIRPLIWINAKNDKKIEQEIKNIIKASDLLDMILKYKNVVNFGNNEWIVCEKKDGNVLLRSKNVICHDDFLGARWNNSFLRTIKLNQELYDNFSDEEKLLIEKNIYEDKFFSLRLRSEQNIKSEDYVFLPYNIYDDYFEIYDNVNFVLEDINNETNNEYKHINFICMDGTKKDGERSVPDVVPYIRVKYKVD